MNKWLTKPFNRNPGMILLSELKLSGLWQKVSATRRLWVLTISENRQDPYQQHPRQSLL
jgi:hypothetical protein